MNRAPVAGRFGSTRHLEPVCFIGIFQVNSRRRIRLSVARMLNAQLWVSRRSGPVMPCQSFPSACRTTGTGAADVAPERPQWLRRASISSSLDILDLPSIPTF